MKVIRNRSIGKKADVCAMCEEPADKTMVYDKCSKTGQRRGYVHKRCALAVKHLKEDPGLAFMALFYLVEEQYSAIIAIGKHDEMLKIYPNGYTASESCCDESSDDETSSPVGQAE